MTPKLRFPEFTHEWQVKRIGDILTIGSGRDYKHLKSGDVPVYGTGGYMLSVSDYLYDGESVAIGRKGTIDKPQFLTGKFWTVDTLFYTHGYKESSPRFILGVFNNINWQKYNEASGVPSLSKVTLEKIKVNVPSEKEQQKIADFLTAVDEKIAKLEKKQTSLETYKRGVMQQIFSQKIRFTKPDGSNYPDWQTKKLGNYFVDFKQKSSQQDEYQVMTSSREGLISQRDYYGRDNRITDRSNVGYNILPPNYLTYRSRSDDGRFKFNLNKTTDTVIVSYFYPVFSVKDGDEKFFEEYLNYSWRIFYKYSVGTSQKVLAHSELKKIALLMPHSEEQQKIADLLSAVDSKIQLNNDIIQKAKQFKKLLLQRMFV